MAARRAGAELLLSYTRVMDDAPLWDFPAQRDTVDVPAALVSRQPYGTIDAIELETALRGRHQAGDSTSDGINAEHITSEHTTSEDIA